jgi:hypothetical protein
MVENDLINRCQELGQGRRIKKISINNYSAKKIKARCLALPMGKRNRTNVMVKGSYLLGSRARYYGKIRIIESTEILSKRHRSQTNMFVCEIGFRDLLK